MSKLSVHFAKRSISTATKAYVLQIVLQAPNKRVVEEHPLVPEFRLVVCCGCCDCCAGFLESLVGAGLPCPEDMGVYLSRDTTNQLV